MWRSMRRHSLPPGLNRGSPLGGSAEGPHVAVVPVLPPTGLIGMHHRTASDPFHYIGHHSLGMASHPLRGVRDGSHTDAQPILQPLDHDLLTGYDGDEHITVSGGQVNFRIHTRYMT